MTSKLTLYNGALLKLGEPDLASLSENRAPRRHLDRAWDNGAVRACLELGQWKFAMRSSEYTYSPSVTPGFGFDYGFNVPSDLVRLAGVWQDANMAGPAYRGYREEAGYWYADIDTLYIRYVSDDTDYGNDLSLWPQSFVEVVEAHLAYKTAKAITGSDETMAEMLALRDKKLLPIALSRDAMQEPARDMQAGDWVRARVGGGNLAREHGWRGR